MPKQTKELRSLSQTELQARMADIHKELIKVNAQVATGTIPKNPHQIRNAKRTVSRILTIQRENELRQALDAAQKTERTKKDKPAKAGKEATQA